MYPAGDLRELERRRARLQARITRRRRECVAEARMLVEPIQEIDLWRERLKRFSTYLPLGLAALAAWRQSRPPPEASTRRRGFLGWLPVVAQGIRVYRKFSART